MTTPASSSATWVFHRGALGDSILLWPLLRALRPTGVTLVTDGSKARLAAQELGVSGLDAEQDRFNALWRKGAHVVPVVGVGRVIAFTPGADDAGTTWLDNARRMFPGARIESFRQRPDRVLVGGLARALGGDAPVPARLNPQGPLAVHVGASSRAKRWPLRRFAMLIEALKAPGPAVHVIAGEVENEQFDPGERALFGRLDGRFIADLDELAALLRPSRLFIGCDSGPTHLAAQLGIATLALFGPTSTERWAPAGPRVQVLAPPLPAPMEWLDERRVLHAVAASLGIAGGHTDTRC